MSNDKAVEMYIEYQGIKVGIGLSEETIAKIANANSTLFAPATAWLKGQEAKITTGFLPFYDKLAERKNQNLQNLAIDVIRELKNREDSNAEIPEKFEDTDNLLLIQENASTTSNEEFLKLWAKIYTEEACKPGFVTRKTIKLLESLDISTVKILENDIFPFCDDSGFYWGNEKRLNSVLIAQDFGILDSKDLLRYSLTINVPAKEIINNELCYYVYPNFGYAPRDEYILTKSGLEIKNILKIFPSQNNINEVIKTMEKSSEAWKIIDIYDKTKLKNTITNRQKFIICDKNNNIIYPTDQEYKTYAEFYQNAMANIEVIDET